jgi:choline dehydrogenase-like flavoprotein
MINKEAVDVVIVGAGASGSLLAAKLSEGGKKVVVLDAGPPWHLRDLFSSEIWARRLKWASAPIPSGGAAPIGVGFNIGGGFGGSALHHYANWYRLHPGDFKEYSLFGENLDWPITYEDLQPFYDQIQMEVGVSGDTEAETSRPPAAPYPMPPLKSFRQGSLLVKGCEALGIQNFPTPHAINSIEYKGRSACLLDGWCDAGCPIGALANPLVVNIPAARAAGADFRSYSNVTKVLADSQLVTGVVYRDRDGSEHFQPADVVILAAFAIGTPRLLLNSATSRFPAGLANSSTTVGQYTTSHITTPTYALFDEYTEPFKGVTGGSFSSQDGYDEKKKNGYFGSYTLAGASALKPNDLIGIANTRSDLFGAALQTFMMQAAQHINNILPVGETKSLPQNRVTLSSQTDMFGVPLAQVTHQFDNNDLQLSAAAATQAVRIFNAAGATQVWQGSTSWAARSWVLIRQSQSRTVMGKPMIYPTYSLPEQAYFPPRGPLTQRLQCMH